MDKIKRLAIFAIYDKDGIIDDYITYYLNEIRRNVSHLVVVCNGKLTEEGRIKLTAITEDVFVRPNVGYDCGAVKDALFNFIGWDKVYEYDELLIANDTVYGPFYPLKRVFDEMDGRDVDFWGLTKQFEIKKIRCSEDDHTTPEHIQSYFISIKKNLLHSREYYEFWKELDAQSFTFSDAIKKYEIGFSAEFSEKGYKYDAYISFDLRELEKNYIVTHMTPLRLLDTYDFPFVKKKSFTVEQEWLLMYRADKKPNQVIRYIGERTNYNIDLIWSNLIRTTPADELTENLNLRFALPGVDDKSIKQLFDENPRLGVLYEPEPYYSDHFETFISKRKELKKVWYKDEAIKDSSGFKNSDLPEIARKNGYYSAIVQTVDNVIVRCRDFEYMLFKIGAYLSQSHRFSRFFNMFDFIRINDICEFREKHTELFIYGAGEEARYFTRLILQGGISFSGFVVSDGQPKEDEMAGRKIFFLSEIESKKDDCGIVIALDKNNTKAVLPILKEKGFKNILRLN